jgi:hypothetical protein
VLKSVSDRNRLKFIGKYLEEREYACTIWWPTMTVYKDNCYVGKMFEAHEALQIHVDKAPLRGVFKTFDLQPRQLSGYTEIPNR